VTARVGEEAALRDEATSLLQHLIRIDTVNPPGDERRAQELLAEYFRDAGLECELLGIVAERPNLIARLRGEGPGPTLCYLGHVDTVLANADEWTVDPWSGELRDGFVWGRGALDMKGQVACEAAAVASLARAGWRPLAGDLIVVSVCDEEAGSALGARWLCEQATEKVRCDWLINEGAGERIEFEGRSLYSICVGEKGVFRFELATEGKAGHASIPGIGENALLKMVRLLSRLDGRQPAFDSYPEALECLAALLGRAVEGPEAGLEQVRAAEPRLAALLEPMLGVTLSPTMIRASEKENVIPSRCSVLVDCRVPPRFAADHVKRRVAELLGSPEESGYRLSIQEQVLGNSSPLRGRLAEAVTSWVAERDTGTDLLPVVLPGFTDSHWFRKAFPDCSAYGFFPQRSMSIFETTPLVHSSDERIAVEDLGFASSFYHALPQRLLC
jgi:acetylornithine deacetylase/succinyl-diaminopimelate desuccinylase-like protein